MEGAGEVEPAHVERLRIDVVVDGDREGLAEVRRVDADRRQDRLRRLEPGAGVVVVVGNTSAGPGSTHAPDPLQRATPPPSQGNPNGALLVTGLPLTLHATYTQSPTDAGTFEESITVVSAPPTPQTAALQSGGESLETGVPGAENVVTQRPATHAASTHGDRG